MSRPPSAPADEGAPASFRRLATLTFAATYALIVIGGVVRATHSGDACPDWPRCHGELLPPLETDVLIEFSHRFAASVVGLLVLATTIAAWRMRGITAPVRWGTAAAVALVIGQIVLGGATVLNELDPALVSAHLAMGSTLLAVLLAVALWSLPDATGERTAGAASFRNLAVVAALATLALMLTGAYVRGSGASLAFRDWPLFDGRLLPEGGRLAMIHATHRLAAAAAGLLLGVLAINAWRAYRRPAPAMLGVALALTIYVAQVFVGAANVWTSLRAPATAAHVALSAALWATLVGIALLAQRDAQAAPAASRRVAREPVATTAGEPSPGPLRARPS